MRIQAHTRRFAKLRESAMDVDADTDVRDLVRARSEKQTEKPAAEGKLSKRAQKKVRLAHQPILYQTISPSHVLSKQSLRPSRRNAQNKSS